MKYDLLIFDLDGTILYTLEDLTDAVNHGLMEYHLPVRSISEVKSFVGDGIRKLIERAVSEESQDKVDDVHKAFTEYYSVHLADKTKPYDGIVETLKSLKAEKYKLAVVSNKADYGVKELCEQYFAGLFDIAIGEREGIRRKPWPDAVDEVLRSMNISKASALYIGDSEVDIKTAENAGVDCISVSWGFRARDFLLENGASVIVDDMTEMIDAIKRGVN